MFAALPFLGSIASSFAGPLLAKIPNLLNKGLQVISHAGKKIMQNPIIQTGSNLAKQVIGQQQFNNIIDKSKDFATRKLQNFVDGKLKSKLGQNFSMRQLLDMVPMNSMTGFKNDNNSIQTGQVQNLFKLMNANTQKMNNDDGNTNMQRMLFKNQYPFKKRIKR